jgi:hypothetical protein
MLDVNFLIRQIREYSKKITRLFPPLSFLPYLPPSLRHQRSTKTALPGQETDQEQFQEEDKKETCEC